MVRVTALWLLVAFLAAYAWRDWYKSLCGLILLMAVYQHPDFPKTLMGIQGMNVWNILLAVVFIAWAKARSSEGLKWDMPSKFGWYLAIFLIVIVISFLRLVTDLTELEEIAFALGEDPPTVFGLASEYIINCLKWIVPAFLLFDGCRSEKRLKLAVVCILAVYVLLAVQVIRWMPLSTLASGADLSERAIKILSNEVGYHRVNLSMLLAGASWAVFSARELVESKAGRVGLYGLCLITFVGMALTGGRMGYVTWAALGAMFAVLKWRRIIIFAPVAIAMIMILVPAARDRFMQGFTPESIDTNLAIESLQFGDDSDAMLYTVTSGRTFAWPFVLEKIGEAPLVGYGRDAMASTGLALFLAREYGELFQHPHNMYLQWIMDNGIVGAVPVFLLFFFVWKLSRDLFLQSDNKYAVAIGGIALSLVGALLIAGMGSQTFYPREGSVGMWSSIALALRIYVQQ
ncbi:MAG: O-antigen ligase domain-containing protein, partial [Desulfobulbaceae bacterium]|nr:O-antigen ligase domain-containing protein [Desulfobulbaceae bacterium]